MLSKACISIVLCAILKPCTLVYGLFEQCDHQITLNSGGSIYINSPYYPNKYPSGSSCRYTVTAPLNNRINFQCNIEFDTTQQQCSTDIFYLNQQGSTSIPGSEFFCGNGQLNENSDSNVAVISYVSSGQYTAGRFTCLARTISTGGGEPKTCDCGWSVTRKIVGGAEAGINEFPSVAGVYNKIQMRIYCGASIISKKFLLSAAHCFVEENCKIATNLAVIVGDHDFTITTDTPYTRTHDVERIIIHEKYSINTKRYDIALLKTTTPMEWSNGVGPACLPFNYNSFTITKVDVAGWGTLSYGGRQPNRLQKATLNIVRNPQCKRQIPNVIASQICTYTYGKDTCQYDSGGGVFYRSNRMFVVGITSYGFGCASMFPSISTRVSSFLNWIQARTNANFCRK